MPQDGITIAYLARELDEMIANSKITKVTQPETDEVHLFLYTKNGNKKLVISAGGNSPRCHFTAENKVNPPIPYGFCMLLRKYLTNAIVLSVNFVEGDRIIKFETKTKNELDDEIGVTLLVELISRQSNIILVNSDSTVLGALKTVSFDNSSRAIMAGIKYELPDLMGKIPPYEEIAVRKALESYSEGNVTQFISSTIAGLSFQSANEMVFDTFSKTEVFSMTDIEREKLAKNIVKFASSPLSEISPCVGFDKDKIKDYFFKPYSHLNMPTLAKETLSDAISTFYFEKDKKERMSEHSKTLRNLLKNHISRNEKKLSAQLEQLVDCENMEADKIKGDLITSNLYKITKGMEKIRLQNYYDENMAEIDIALNKTISPSKNAQHYYSRYAKKRRTVENVSVQLVQTKAHLEMLYNFLSNLSSLSSIDEVSLIKQDLINSGLVKAPKDKKGRKVKEEKTAPLIYDYEGYKIYVGRNSTENEYITHKLGRNKDMWFHVKKAFGSHVLIKYEGIEISDNAMIFAAELAAFYSALKEAEKIEVDYTEVKNVKKPPSGNLGLVIYNTNYSMFVPPNQHIEFKIK